MRPEEILGIVPIRNGGTGLSGVGAVGTVLTSTGNEAVWAVGGGGSQGPQGPQGAPGAAGAQGAQGPAGANGGTGPQGPQGAAGANGGTGPQGAQGAPGANGGTGPQGAQGAAGANGGTGPQGPQGAAGANGGTGPQGAQGAQGPAGTSAVTPIEIVDTIPMPEGASANAIFDAAGATFKGGSFWLQRACTLSKLWIEIAAKTTNGTLVVALYQTAGGLVSNALALKGTAVFTVTAAGVQSVVFSGGPIALDEGLVFINYALTAGAFTLRSYDNASFPLINQAGNVPNGSHPTTYTTNIAATVTPAATFNPLVGGGAVTADDAPHQITIRLTT